jgi:hypothetical protein
MQQLHAELGLEIDHLLAQRGLRDAQALGGAHEVQAFGDLDEGLQQTTVHAWSLHDAGLRCASVAPIVQLLPPMARRAALPIQVRARVARR